MRRTSSLNKSERIGFILLATLTASLAWSLHSSASKFDETYNGEPASVNNAAPKPIQNPTPCCNDKPHLLVGTYYSVKNGLTSKLLLNNKGPDPLTASPTLFSMSGERFNVPPVTIDGKSFQMIDMSAWISSAGPQFQEGSIEVFHLGKDLVLGSQLYLVDEQHSLSFDEKLVETTTFKSTRLEGLWWLPSQKGQVQLAVSNKSDSVVTATVNADGRTPQRAGQQTLTLAPHETRLLDVQSDVIEHANGAMPRSGGISVTFSGSPGAVFARGMAEDSSLGYSLAIQFSDPATAKSSQLQGAGLRLGSAGGEVLTPIAVVRNVGSTATTVTGRVSYTDAGGATNVVSLDDLNLAAAETVIVDLGKLLQQHSYHQPDAVGGLELEYSSEKGSVIASVFSVSTSGNQVFRVPMWDVAAQRSPTGGYPWYIDGNSSTTVYLKNAERETQKYFVQVNYAGGVYAIGMKQLEAGQTVSYDLRKLRDEQVPDNRGRVIPLDVSRGQVHWSANGSGMIIGRSEQADLVSGISSNYACMNCCGDIPYSRRVMPNSAPTVAVDTSFLFTAEEEFQDCYQNIGDFMFVTDASWSSSDINVATVEDLNGNVTGQGPGTATITASWREYIYHYTPFLGQCTSHQDHFSAASSVNVFDVQILRDGTDITGQTADVIVGQRIDLALQAVPSGSASQIQWSVPGNPIGGYVANNSTGTVTALGSLQSSALTFYWLEGGDGRQVTVSFNVNGVPFSKAATFNVKRPTAQISITTSSTNIGTDSLSGATELRLGNPDTTPGLTFTRTVSIPSGFNGSTQWVQVFTKKSVSLMDFNAQVTALNKAGLDDVYPYPLDAGATSANLKTSDTPALFLDGFVAGSVDFEATMWLLFRPTAGTNPIWVPLRKVSWVWTANATYDGTTWTISSHSDPTNLSDSDSTSHPQWTTNAN